MGRSLVVTLTAVPTPGTPVSDQTCTRVDEYQSTAAMYSVVVADNECAGWMVSSPCGGGKKVIAAPAPARRSALLSTTNSVPRKLLLSQALPVRTILSSLMPSFS